MSARPIRDQIVVTKNDAESVSAGGIHIVVHEEKNVQGTVLSVGSGRVSISGTVVPLEVKVGDTVLFNKNTAVEVKDKQGKSVYVLREDAVLCVLD